MYSTWVYEKDRLAWARFNTVVGAALSFFFGAMASFFVWRGIVGFSDFELGLLVGLGFVIIAAVCWYKGFCMQWVAEEDRNDGQERSDDEQYENAGSTTD